MTVPPPDATGRPVRSICVQAVPPRLRRAWLAALALVLPALLAGCNEDRPRIEPHDIGGDPQRGMTLIGHYGCGDCHTVPGIEGADGLVGPPLTTFGRRVYVAGLLRNTPENLVTWIRWPQRVVPGNVMPDMGVGEQDARDIAAYLYTIQ